MASNVEQPDADATVLLSPEKPDAITFNYQPPQQQQPVPPAAYDNITNDIQKSQDVEILSENVILKDTKQQAQNNVIGSQTAPVQRSQPLEPQKYVTDPELIVAYHQMVSEIKEMDQQRIYADRQLLITSKKLDIQEEKLELQCDPMDNILRKCIAVQLESILKCQATESALTELTNLTVEYMSILFTNLRRLTEIQRRRVPGKKDLSLLVREGYFNWAGIEESIEDDKKLSSTNISTLSKFNKEAERVVRAMDHRDEDEEVQESDPTFVFLNDISSIISEVVPPSKSSTNNKHYIPHWMPALPPDHTYKSTPRYTKRITEPRRLKEALVREGRLGETALHHIIDKKIGVNHISEVGVSDPEVDDFSDSSSDNEEENGKLEQNSNGKLDGNIPGKIAGKTLKTAEPADIVADSVKQESSDLVVPLTETLTSIPSLVPVSAPWNSTGSPLVPIKQEESVILPPASLQNDHTSNLPSVKQEVGAPASNDTISNFLIDKLPQVTHVKMEAKAIADPANSTSPDTQVIGDNSLSQSEQSKAFDIVAFAKKRMEQLEKRKSDKKKLVKERLNSEEAKLGKNLGFYTNNTYLPDNYHETLNNYYNDKFNEIRRNLVIQQKKRDRYLEKQELKRRKQEEEENNKNDAVTEFQFDFGDEQDDVDMDEFQFNDDDEDAGVK